MKIWTLLFVGVCLVGCGAPVAEKTPAAPEPFAPATKEFGDGTKAEVKPPAEPPKPVTPPVEPAKDPYERPAPQSTKVGSKLPPPTKPITDVMTNLAYPGWKVDTSMPEFKGTIGGVEVKSVIATTADSPDKVADFYRKLITVTQDKTNKQGGQSIMSITGAYERHEIAIQITVFPDTKKTNVSLTVKAGL